MLRICLCFKISINKYYVSIRTRIKKRQAKKNNKHKTTHGRINEF